MCAQLLGLGPLACFTFHSFCAGKLTTGFHIRLTRQTEQQLLVDAASHKVATDNLHSPHLIQNASDAAHAHHVHGQRLRFVTDPPSSSRFSSDAAMMQQ